MKTLQVAEVISQGGRDGRVETADGRFSADFQANGDASVTPEDLFAAAYAACFHSAILNHAEKGHFKIDGSTVTGRVSLNENQQGGYQLAVELRASLPGVSRSDAEHLMHQAHQTCPYSKAVRTNIPVSLVLD
jgi:osmotically inducible protein OsmC